MKSNAIKLVGWILAGLLPCMALAQAEPQDDPTTDATGLTPRPAQEMNILEMSIPQLNSAAELLVEQGRLAEASGLVQEVLRRDRNNLAGLRLAGEIAWEAQQMDAARTNWQRVRSIQPNDFVANYGLGRLYLISRVPRSAMSFLEAALPVAPAEERPELLVYLAQAYRGSGMAREARETIDDAIELAPDNFDAWSVRVALRTENAAQLQDFERALNDADQLIRLATATLEKDVSLESTRRLYNAYDSKLNVLREFRKVLFRQNPDGTLSNAVLPGREQTAARVMSGVADVLMRQRNLRHAMANYEILPFAERAVEYDGGTNAETLMDLGALQAATGQLDAALASYLKARTLAPDNEEIQQAIRLLEQQGARAPGARRDG